MLGPRFVDTQRPKHHYNDALIVLGPPSPWRKNKTWDASGDCRPCEYRSAAASDSHGEVSRQPQPKIALADTTPRRSNGIRRAPLPLAAAKGARRQRRSPALLVRVDARHEPLRFFCEDGRNGKEARSPTAPTLSHTHMIYQSTSWTRRPENQNVRRCRKRNSGRHAQGARRDGRNIKNTTINPLGMIQQYTRWWVG